MGFQHPGTDLLKGLTERGGQQPPAPPPRPARQSDGLVSAPLLERTRPYPNPHNGFLGCQSTNVDPARQVLRSTAELGVCRNAALCLS